jgi:predicted DNA binding CopG/RHH family protein
MKKPVPTLETDRKAERLVAETGPGDFDLSNGQIVRFEMRPKDKAVSLRLPEKLLDAVRGEAKREGIPYQRFIRMAIETALHRAARKQT